MPLPDNSIPRYRKHKASGQAVVTLSSQDFYLGPHGTKTSHADYDRQAAEWLARGRRPIAHGIDAEGYTVVELIAGYKRFACGDYRKNGRVTNEVAAILSAAAFVRRAYGREPVSNFGPLKLQAIQQSMIQAGLSRKHINKQIGRIVRMFAWGVAQEKVAPSVAQALREVKGLHKGRTLARETEPILPVDDATVEKTLPFSPSRCRGDGPNTTPHGLPARGSLPDPTWGHRCEWSGLGILPAKSQDRASWASAGDSHGATGSGDPASFHGPA